MGTLTPEQTALVLKGLGQIRVEVRALLQQLDQLLTIFGSIPPKPGP